MESWGHFRESRKTMNEMKQSHHPQTGTESEGVQKDHRPYWKRAHRDWRVWVGVVLMLTGMFIYVMTDDFSLRFRSRPEPPPVNLRK